MKAIVLTCDQYRPFAVHMMDCYSREWPEHPFTFVLPYTVEPGLEGARRTWVRTGSSFKSRVLDLLDPLPDEEWVYWCLDDKYPLRLEVSRISAAIKMLESEDWRAVSGLCLCRGRTWVKAPALSLQPCEWQGFDERTTWNHIWLHQFLRVGVLRYLFSHFSEDIVTGKELDRAKFQVPKRRDHRLLVPRQGSLILGESTHRGKATKNCHRAMESKGFSVPDWAMPPTRNEITIGVWDESSLG